MIRGFKRNTKIVIILIVLLIIGVFIYKSPDEAYWLEEKPYDAIKIGRTFAYCLLIGYKQKLLKIAVGPAKTKVENSNFHEIVLGNTLDELQKRKVPIQIISPLLPDQNDLDLIELKKVEPFIVMIFVYKRGYEIIEIPGKGKMLFFVTVRYYRPIDDRIIPKLIRKIANLPLLRNFTGRMGTTGRWVVYDYNYTYSLSDYLDWILKTY